ncbi:MAG: hypothetical protein HKO56_03715, partial [Bacteroidia bacterium]|nr:hypothetical protein [Bacteroidia bacterium]NNM15744.1 hypothetical protein [Bacteroidia bacterium]
SVDGVVAIESSCYAEGKDKAPVLNEMYRVLKPGHSVAIADCFVKQNDMSKNLKRLYKRICRGWAVEDFAHLEEFVSHMNTIGFKNIKIEEVSWRIAPSVMHVPWVSLKFLLKQLFEKNNPMNKHRWNNVISPLLSILLGMHRKTIGYYLISAKK